MRHLPAGFETRRRQSADGTVLVVVDGSDLVLFGYPDKASQVKLDLYREYRH